MEQHFNATDTSVIEYHLEFEKSAALLLNLPLEMLEKSYLRGLKPEIQVEMEILQGTQLIGLVQIMNMSIKVDKHYKALKVVLSGAPSNTFQSPPMTAALHQTTYAATQSTINNDSSVSLVLPKGSTTGAFLNTSSSKPVLRNF